MENEKQQKIVAILLIVAGLLNIALAYVNFATFQLREKSSFPVIGLILLLLGIGKVWRINQLKKLN